MQNHKKTNWQRLKEDPKKMEAYKTWRRQYLSRKQVRTFVKSKSVADVKLSRKGVVYDITDFLYKTSNQSDTAYTSTMGSCS